MKSVLVLVVAGACSSPKPAQPDAGPAIDGATSDAPGDAAMFTPSCTSGADVLYITSPSWVGPIASAGNTLYVGTTDLQAGTSAIVPIDLTTQVPGTPFVPTGANVPVWAGAGSVIATETRADGAIWRFDGGNTPTQVVAHRDMPTAATEAGGYVYWAEADGMARRQLATGGPIEPLFACGGPIHELHVAGSQLFCVSGSSITRGLAAGGGVPVTIAGIDDQQILTLVGDGTTLYFVNAAVPAEIWQLPVVSDTATLAYQDMDRPFFGLTLAGPSLYTTSTVGVVKIDRATFTPRTIAFATRFRGDPLVANDQLYFMNPDGKLVDHCAD